MTWLRGFAGHLSRIPSRGWLLILNLHRQLTTFFFCLGPRYVVQIGEKVIDYNEDFKYVVQILAVCIL